MKIKFEKGQNYHIPFDKEVKIKTYKRFKKVIYVSHKANNLKQLRPIKGKKFVNIKTGNIKAYTQSDKFKSKKSLIRTLEGRVKDLLENNFEGGNSEKFLTLTFDDIAVNFNDLTKLMNNFWRRLKRYCNKKGLSLICLYVKEVHQSGNWHIHVLLKEINNKTLFINIDDLKKIWKNGGVFINPVSSEKDKSDIEINIEKEILEGYAGKTHSFNKLVDYMCKLHSKENVIPSRGRVYGTKGNLQLPKSTHKLYREAYYKDFKNSHLKSENTLNVKDVETNCILNSIHNEIWVEDKPNNSNDLN